MVSLNHIKISIMKKAITPLLIVLALLATADLASAQKFPAMDKSPADIATYPKSYRISDKNVKVVYSRPQKKDREIFGSLVDFDKVWRTGANEATEITFYQDSKIGDQVVPAGTYSLFTIPGESEWTIIINSKLNQWGAYSYDKSADVARTTVSASTDPKPLEEFSITFDEDDDNVHMVLGWDTTRVAVPVSF